MERNTVGLARAFLERNVKAGDVCVDATAGRGRDTALLCRLAGETGQVFAFDIQAEALRQTKLHLQEENLSAHLICDSHSDMNHYLKPGTVQAIVFNFGRLPGGDPHIFTMAETSVKAVGVGLQLLKPGGVMSLSIYYGGANGYDERNALLQYLRELDQRQYSVLLCDWANRKNDSPVSAFIWKER